MNNNKQIYLKTIIRLIGVIILLIIYINVQPIETKTVEIIKEFDSEKEENITVEIDPLHKYNINAVKR